MARGKSASVASKILFLAVFIALLRCLMITDSPVNTVAENEGRINSMLIWLRFFRVAAPDGLLHLPTRTFHGGIDNAIYDLPEADLATPTPSAQSASISPKLTLSEFGDDYPSIEKLRMLNDEDEVLAQQGANNHLIEQHEEGEVAQDVEDLGHHAEEVAEIEVVVQHEQDEQFDDVFDDLSPIEDIGVEYDYLKHHDIKLRTDVEHLLDPIQVNDEVVVQEHQEEENNQIEAFEEHQVIEDAVHDDQGEANNHAHQVIENAVQVDQEEEDHHVMEEAEEEHQAQEVNQAEHHQVVQEALGVRTRQPTKQNEAFYYYDWD